MSDNNTIAHLNHNNGFSVGTVQGSTPMSNTKTMFKYLMRIKIGDNCQGTLPLIGIGRLYKNQNEFNQNKEDTILLDCNNGDIMIVGKKSKYIDGAFRKGMQVDVLLDMKNGVLGFQVDNVFQGVALKNKNLKKGVFHLTVVLNDYAKCGTSVEVMPYRDEYQIRIEGELKRLKEQEAEF